MECPVFLKFPQSLVRRPTYNINKKLTTSLQKKAAWHGILCSTRDFLYKPNIKHRILRLILTEQGKGHLCIWIWTTGWFSSPFCMKRMLLKNKLLKKLLGQFQNHMLLHWTGPCLGLCRYRLYLLCSSFTHMDLERWRPWVRAYSSVKSKIYSFTVYRAGSCGLKLLWQIYDLMLDTIGIQKLKLYANPCQCSRSTVFCPTFFWKLLLLAPYLILRC